MKHLSETQIIQLAGLLSGRGSFYMSTPNKNGRQYPVISFSTTDDELALQVGMMLKVPVRQKSKGEFSSTVYELRLSGEAAENLLERMRPYLMGSKEYQVEKMLGYV